MKKILSALIIALGILMVTPAVSAMEEFIGYGGHTYRVEDWSSRWHGTFDQIYIAHVRFGLIPESEAIIATNADTAFIVHIVTYPGVPSYFLLRSNGRRYHCEPPQSGYYGKIFPVYSEIDKLLIAKGLKSIESAREAAERVAEKAAE